MNLLPYTSKGERSPFPSFSRTKPKGILTIRQLAESNGRGGYAGELSFSPRPSVSDGTGTHHLLSENELISRFAVPFDATTTISVDCIGATEIQTVSFV